MVPDKNHVTLRLECRIDGVGPFCGLTTQPLDHVSAGLNRLRSYFANLHPPMEIDFVFISGG